MRPGLIVPIRDRRHRKRILTLKNFGYALAALAVVFVALSLDISRRGTPGDYGRLFGKQVGTNVQPSPRQPDIVREAPVADETVADPLLVAPAAREQMLGTPEQRTINPPDYKALGAPAPQVQTTGSGPSVNVVGDSGGVVIVRGATAKPPVLAGGVFKQ